MISWLGAFAVTQAIECPIYGWALRTRSHRWLWAFALSAVTHPIIFCVFPTFFPTDYWIYVSWAEAFAVGVEALILRGLGVPAAFRWALLANGASVLVGLSLRAGFGWP